MRPGEGRRAPPPAREMKSEPEDTTLPMSQRGGQRARHPALVFLRGELLAAPIPLERDEVTLGRALEAAVRVNDARASRSHARITVERDPESGEPRYRLQDLGSTNGTFLNGEPLSGPQPLHVGDRIRIGDSEFTFER